MKRQSQIKKRRSIINKNEHGSVSILVMLMMVVILASTGAVIDVGVVLVNRTQLSNALDYAALAGAQELPDNTSDARAVATDYLIQNNVNPSDVIIAIGSEGKSITITGNRPVEYAFLRIVGLQGTTVNAQSKVVLGAVSSIKGGLRPFAIEDFPYAYGAEVVLKQGAGDGYHGNYGVVALGGSGSSVYEANALYGYAGTVSIGDELNTEPGNMANVSNQLQTYINGISDTFANHTRKSDRLWTVPLVDSLEENGRGSVIVTGFAQVYVEQVQKKAGQIQITARFIKFVVNGDIDTSIVDRGTYGIKLVN
jgi:hypothetical protein